MIKLALIGKNISHSKSQQTYEKILEKKVHYDLIDIASEQELPPLDLLLKKYDGLSITSPYKRSYLNNIDHVENDFESVNALKLVRDKIYATNTDFEAIKEILQGLTNNKCENFVILGDGAMSVIVKEILKISDKRFSQYSRKLKNLDQVSTQLNLKDNSLCVINTCSREYSYNGRVDFNYIFWDMNYDHSIHQSYFKDSKVDYFDGTRQLEIQAKYALKFWNL